jgi:hypothetical protein
LLFNEVPLRIQPAVAERSLSSYSIASESLNGDSMRRGAGGTRGGKFFKHRRRVHRIRPKDYYGKPKPYIPMDQLIHAALRSVFTVFNWSSLLNHDSPP